MNSESFLRSSNEGLQEILSVINSLPDVTNSTDVSFLMENLGTTHPTRIQSNTQNLQRILGITKAKPILIDFEFNLNDDGSFELTAWRGTFESKNSKHLLIPDTSEIAIKL